MIFFIIFNTFRLSYLPFAKYNICPILDVEHMHTRNQNCSLNFNQIESEWLKYLNYSLCFINFTCLQQNKLFLLGYYIFFFKGGCLTTVWIEGTTHSKWEMMVQHGHSVITQFLYCFFEIFFLKQFNFNQQLVI